MLRHITVSAYFILNCSLYKTLVFYGSAFDLHLQKTFPFYPVWGAIKQLSYYYSPSPLIIPGCTLTLYLIAYWHQAHIQLNKEKIPIFNLLISVHLLVFINYLIHSF